MNLFLAVEILISHWCRKPGQFITLIIGLSLATGLWTGVQAINSEARHSYEEAADTISSGQNARIERKDGKPISLQTYVLLQRSGWRTSPELEGVVKLSPQTLTVLGIEPLTAPRNSMSNVGSSGQGVAAAILNPANNPDGSDVRGVAFANSKTIQKIKDDLTMPVLRPADGMPEETLLMDIGLAERLLRREGEISNLTVLPEQPFGQPTLGSIVPDLVLIKPENGNDIGRLTDSFHLNLTAFGLLAFLVGLFIVYGTVGLAFEQRRNAFRTMRVLGISSGTLVLALLLELVVIAMIAGALGVALGYLIAAALLPDVAATLRGLYGAPIEGVLTIRAEWWLSGLALALGGTLVAAATSLSKLVRLPILAAAQPRAWAMASRGVLFIQVMVAGTLFVLALAMGGLGSGLLIGFMIIGAVLVGTALLLPPLLHAFLFMMERWTSGPLTQWFWADTRQQLPGLSFALMALLLALAANIGVSTMVGSFRTTFTGWLDQRLASEVYIRARDETQADALIDWLKPRAETILPIWNVDINLNGTPGKIYGIADHSTYHDHWPLIDSVANVWDHLGAGKMLIVNEQLARRQHLSLGDPVIMSDGHTLPIGGIYSDYGNPQPQVMVSVDLLLEWFPNVEKLRYAVRIDPQNVAQLISDAKAQFDFKRDGIADQEMIKRFSLRVFERTFSVTGALNVLTLTVAGFAIFTSLLTLATMRMPQLAPVWALGLTRKRLAILELARAVMLAFITGLFALPLGLVLAWLLLSIVNVEAFGWKLPMTVDTLDWVRLWLFALLAACLAAAIPARRIARTAPAELTKVFAHER